MAEDAPPQWDSEAFDATRATIRNRFGCSDEEAIARLQALWNNTGNERPPTPPAPPVSPAPPDIPSPIPSHRRLPSPDIQQPPRKKATFPSFDPNRSISARMPYYPAQYAIDRVRAMEYVELWYFTSEGILHASKITPTTSEEAISFLKTDAGFAIQPIKASRASRNAILDESLSWEQIMTARHNILEAASKWPDAHRLAMAEFYFNLEALKATGSNARILILYHAVARRQWHTSLKGEDDPFNIANISQDLLTKLESNLRDRDFDELQRQASKVSTRRKNLSLTFSQPPLSHRLSSPPSSATRRDATLPRDTPLVLPRCFALSPLWSQ